MLVIEEVRVHFMLEIGDGDERRNDRVPRLQRHEGTEQRVRAVARQLLQDVPGRLLLAHEHPANPSIVDREHVVVLRVVNTHMDSISETSRPASCSRMLRA